MVKLKPVYIEWIEKSDDNLKWAHDNYKLKSYPLVCFLSQQSIEIILKGYLYFKKKIASKTHELPELYKSCKKEGLNLNEFHKDLALLSEYYFKSRYPDSYDPELEKRSVASNALKKARVIQEEVKKHFV